MESTKEHEDQTSEFQEVVALKSEQIKQLRERISDLEEDREQVCALFLLLQPLLLLLSLSLLLLFVVASVSYYC